MVFVPMPSGWILINYIAISSEKILLRKYVLKHLGIKNRDTLRWFGEKSICFFQLILKFSSKFEILLK